MIISLKAINLTKEFDTKKKLIRNTLPPKHFSAQLTNQGTQHCPPMEKKIPKKDNTRQTNNKAAKKRTKHQKREQAAKHLEPTKQAQK